MFIEYPKSLYLSGWRDLDAHVIVQDAAEEVAARDAGYRGINEPASEEPPRRRSRAPQESTE
jgi:hypothetical protein